MSQKRDIIDYLDDIIDAIASIEEFTAGYTLEKFQNDKKTIFAVIRAFEIIGEASKKFPHNLKNKHPEAEWKKSIL